MNRILKRVILALLLLSPVAASSQIASPGLGSAAYRNTGTSGATVPLLSGANTWATTQTTEGAIDSSRGDISSLGAMRCGADTNASTRTNATAKQCAIVQYPYTNANIASAIVLGQASVTDNNVFIGGGFAGFNAATHIYIYAAANNNTTTGTLVGDCTVSGCAFSAASIGGRAITLGGAFTTSGANAVTLTTVGATNVTLPTSGTLSVNGGIQSCTATLSFGGDSTGITYSTDLCSYVTHDKQVTLTIYKVLTNNGSGSGNASIAHNAPAGLSGYIQSCTFGGGTLTLTGSPQAFVNTTGSAVIPQQITTGTNATLTEASILDTSILFIQCNYIAQ